MGFNTYFAANFCGKGSSESRISFCLRVGKPLFEQESACFILKVLPQFGFHSLILYPSKAATKKNCDGDWNITVHALPTTCG